MSCWCAPCCSTTTNAAVSALSTRWFKQLDRVAIRVFNLNLTSAWTAFHLVAKANADALEHGDTAQEVRDFQHDAVPAARLLTLTVRQRPGARRSRSTQQDLGISERHTGECRQLLVLHFETEILDVEAHGASNILHMVADAVDTRDERLHVWTRCCGVRHRPSFLAREFQSSHTCCYATVGPSTRLMRSLAQAHP